MSLIFWVAVAVGIIIFLVSDFYVNKFPQSVESELVKLSPDYEGSNKMYLRFVLVWVLFTFLLASFLLMLSQKSSQVEIFIVAVMVLVFSAASLLRGIFAINKGIFPTSKYFGSRTLYAYSDNGEIKRFGRFLVIVSSSTAGLAIMLILIFLLA